MSDSKDKTAFMKKTANELRHISILYMERNPGTPKDCCWEQCWAEALSPCAI